MRIVTIFTLAILVLAGTCRASEVVVQPEPYLAPFRNPLRGWVVWDPELNPLGTLIHNTIPWNRLENSVDDGVDKIKAYSAVAWRGYEKRNYKLIVRVVLENPREGKYWPADLVPGDYESAQFKHRLVNFIQKLGQAWDDDPRIAFVEVGLIGWWGEHHNPAPTPEIEALVGDAFTAAFKRKLVMNRYPTQFQAYSFGIYWDSFGHPEEAGHIPSLEAPPLARRWLVAPRGGEPAFDWGQTVGKDPTDAVLNHSAYFIKLIRQLHWNHLGWLPSYDLKNSAAVANAAEIEAVLGYRFVLVEARYPVRLQPGRNFAVALKVRNTGSAPIYYNWPLELSLLDQKTRVPVHRFKFEGVDIRKWLPDEPVTVTGDFVLPPGAAAGEYILALAILDPAGDLPAVRFANRNYYRGGRHPLGLAGVRMEIAKAELADFDDLSADDSLYYLLPPEK